MGAGVHETALQTATPGVGVGPDELAGYWPLVVRVAWFAAGFLVVALLGLYVVEPTIIRIVRSRNRNNPTVREAISRYVRLLVVVVGLYVGAGVAGYTRFLTDSALVIAAGTLAVGVAAQTVIGSLVSGLVLVLDPEFNIGNYVEWEGGEGTIRSITLRVTRVQTQDGELVTIPNTVLTGQAITRPYGHDRYRVVEHVGIAYEDDVDEALDHLEAAAGEVDGVLDAPNPNVYVDEFGSDAVVVRVHYWIANPTRSDVFAVRSNYARRVKTRLEAAGITISPASKRDLQGRIEVGEGEDG
ncbi:MAG: mechanosensitive ion channel family protein [Haloferacaceae archaeon]